MSVCGHYPAELIRCFSCREYAEMFLAGKILIRRNTYYRDIECSNRRDGDEGSGFYLKRGMVTACVVSQDLDVREVREEDGFIKHHVSFGNAVFLLCATRVEAGIEPMKKKFGDYVVRITNPRRLADVMDSRFKALSQRFLIDGKDVTYSRGAVLGGDENYLTDTAFTQKSMAYAAEMEFRYCFIGMGPENLETKNDTQEMTINLGAPLDCAEPLFSL